jgi:phytanoyl-CoA hydroxylase
MGRVLTDADVERYRRDGYLVVPRFVDAEWTERARRRAAELIDTFDPSSHRTVFSTDDQAHGRDDYFLESGDRIRFFFEEGAFDDSGSLVAPAALSINKIGHALHDLDPVFDELSHSVALDAVAHDIGFVDPVVIQSMVIFKQPHIGGEVHLHTDHTFLWTEPQSVTGFWFALEDATIENGCLRVVPGGHRAAPRQRFRRTAEGGTAMEVLDPTPIPTTGEVPVEVEAGTLVVLHGMLPHRSGPNHSARSRHAYTLHAIERSARYPDDNWLHRGAQLAPRGFLPR